MPTDITAEDQDVQFDNFPIKGFAFDAPTNNWEANVRVTNAEDGITVCMGSTKNVAYEFFGADGDKVATLGLDVTWGLVDADDDCVSVVQRDDGSAQLVWKKAGTARIFVTVDGIGTAMANVTALDEEHAWGKPDYVLKEGRLYTGTLYAI